MIKSIITTVLSNVDIASAVAPVITQPPVSIAITQPSSVIFSCSATGLPRPAIRWTMGNTLLSNSPQILINESIAGDRQAASTLTLLQTSTTDIGSYNCIAENEAGTATATASLTVYGERMSSLTLFKMQPFHHVQYRYYHTGVWAHL